MIEVNITQLDKHTLETGCHKVIDCLSEYSKDYKIAILYELINSFPESYKIIEYDSVEVKKDKTN